MGTNPTVTAQGGPTADMGETPVTVSNYVPSWKGQSSSESTEEPAAQNPEPVTAGEQEDVQDAAASTEGAEESQDEQASSGEDSGELPIEQLKEYSAKTYEAYAKRFGMTLTDLEANPNVKEIIRQKIDTDVYAKQLKEQLDAKSAAESVEQEAAENATETTQSADQPKTYEEAIAKFAETITAPEMAEKFTKELLDSWGFDVTNAEDETTKALLGNAKKMATTYTKFGVNLINTALPYILPQMIEQVFPGFGDAWAYTEHQRTYELVRAGDPQFGKLPSYGTPQYDAMMARVREIEPELDHAVFRDAQGRYLSKHENLKRQYRLAMKIASGQQVPPELLRQAVETGKKKQQQADKNARVASVTGSGQSKGTIAPKTSNVGSGLGIVEAYYKRHPQMDL